MSGDAEGSVYEISRPVLYARVCVYCGWGVYNVIHGNAAGCMRSLDVYYLFFCVYCGCV